LFPARVDMVSAGFHLQVGCSAALRAEMSHMTSAGLGQCPCSCCGGVAHVQVAEIGRQRLLSAFFSTGGQVRGSRSEHHRVRGW
jgi:hypothetical protein